MEWRMEHIGMCLGQESDVGRSDVQSEGVRMRQCDSELGGKEDVCEGLINWCPAGWGASVGG